MKVYNLGSLNIDYVYSVEHFVTAGETLSSENMTIFPGGKGLNQSIALARAGVPVIHGAVLGKDGSFLLKTLSDSNVNVDRIKITDSLSGHAIIQVDKNGQNCILLYSGTNSLVDESYIEEFLCDAEKDDIILLQNEVSNTALIMEIAHSKGMRIAFNPSPFKTEILDYPLSNVTWFFCNEIEGKELFGSDIPEEICTRFNERFKNSAMILTLGKKGSIYADSTNIIKQSIYETTPVDTTAAGDTFTGYFIAEIIKGKSVKEALNTASRASSITVSRMGASSSIPYYSELFGGND